MKKICTSGRTPLPCAIVIMLLPVLIHAQTAPKKPPEKPRVVDKGTYRVSAPPGGGWKVEEEKETGGVIFRRTKTGFLEELAMQERKFEITVRQRFMEIQNWRMTEADTVARFMDIIDKLKADAGDQGLSPDTGVMEIEGKKLYYWTIKADVVSETPNIYSNEYGDSYSHFKANESVFYYFPPDFRRAHRYFEFSYGSYLGTDFFRFYKDPGLDPVRAVIGSLEIVDPLLAAAGPDGELLRAAAAGDAEAARLAFDKGAKANAAAPRMTALGAAALYGHRDIIELLLGQGADVNQADEEGGNTPLHQALIGGEAEIAEFFIKAGANVNLPTKKGFTALMFAAGTGEANLVTTLIERGADVAAKTNDARAALIFAADFGSSEIVDLLLGAGADVNAQAADGSTALMRAINLKHAAVVQSLLKKDAALNLKTANGWTALMVAVASGDQATALDLMGRGADVNAKTEDGQTALMKAVEVGQAGIVELLIEKGADVNARDGKKQTALKIAKKRKNKEIVKMLQAAGAKG